VKYWRAKAASNAAMLRPEVKALSDSKSHIAAMRERDLRTSSYHEAGHLIAARHFGLVSWAEVFPSGTKKPMGEKHFIGTTHYNHTTPFRAAVIGWAGLISEDIPDNAKALTSDVVRALFDYTMDMIDMEDEISPTDRACILGHRQTRRACKTAGAILARRRREVDVEAGWMISKWRAA
jgi:hypothetical protein